LSIPNPVEFEEALLKSDPDISPAKMQLIRFFLQSDHRQFLETLRFATPFKQAVNSSVSAELPPLARGGTEPCFPNGSDKAMIPWFPAP